MEEEITEIKEIYEVKGHDNEWELHYPDEGDIKTPVPVYDKEGKLKTVIYAGGDSGNLTKSNMKFHTAKQAVAYAKYLGAENNIKLIKSKPRKSKDKL